MSYFPPMRDIRALTWRIIFAHLLLLTTFGLFVKIGGPLQRERNDTKKIANDSDHLDWIAVAKWLV